MIKIGLFIGILTALLIITPLAVLASTPAPIFGTVGDETSTYNSFFETQKSAGYETHTEINNSLLYVGTIVQYVIATLGIIIFILIIYAGFRWMTAQGNSEQVDEAKSWLRNGIIGLLLVMMAYGIALFIVNRLGGAAGIVGTN